MTARPDAPELTADVEHETWCCVNGCPTKDGLHREVVGQMPTADASYTVPIMSVGTPCLGTCMCAAAVDKTGASDADFQQMLARVEAAPDAPESLRERVAVATYEAVGYDAQWWELNDWVKDRHRFMADAALAVVRGEQ